MSSDDKKWTLRKFVTCFNPLLPSAAYMRRSAKILILFQQEISKNISYERRDYESVDENSLS